MSEYVPKKSLGQHWLYDKTSLEAVAEMADVKQGDLVLEVGPGKGTLTDVLLDKGAQVVAVELDDSLALLLRKKYAQEDIKL
jgi:16S rRNA A1518/A1519 N6-dimethyltransferase RsmA/KsgA/DIM1 with predicted DNA glycosylase/AP lyase activity